MAYTLSHISDLTASLGFVLASLPLRFARAEEESGSDTITPIASSIHALDNIALDIEGGKRTLSLAYARQGITVFPLPVWIADGEVELLCGSPPKTARFCTPDQILLQEGDPTPLRLRIRLVNLLANEKTRKMVQSRLREEIASLSGQKAEAIRLEDPILDRTSYRLTLCAAGGGGGDGPAEVILSRTSRLPRIVPEGSGEIDIELLPDRLAAWQAEKGRPITLRDVYLRIEGLLRARFERLQYQSNFTLVSQALTNLQNHLRSITPDGREAPKVLLYVPVGGEVEQTRSAGTVFTQYLVGTIHIREGTDPNHDLGAIQELADRVLQRVLEQVRLNDLDDKKRVALLLGDQAALTATVGEIRTLAAQSREERDQQLTSALDDSEATRSGQSREYTGKIGLDDILPLPAPLPASGEVKGGLKKTVEQDQARRRREVLEAVNRGLEEVGKHFGGRLPTLSGIQFDQKGLTSSLGQVELELKQHTFTTGWSHHEWPAVRLIPSGAEVFDPRVMADQLSQARVRFEEFQKLIESPERLRSFETAYARVVELEKGLKAIEQAASAMATELEKRMKERLKAIEQAATTMATELEKRVKDYTEVPMFVGCELLTLEGHTKSVYAVAFSPDGKRLATGSDDATARLWDTSTGEQILTLTGHRYSIKAVAFSPDGKRLATGSDDLAPQVRLWDTSTGKQILTLTGHRYSVKAVAFSPDGKRLATGSDDTTARLWDTSTGEQILTLTGHAHSLEAVAFSSDGKRLATSDGATVRLWDTSTGEQILTLKSYGRMAFSPDGKRLATRGEDNTARLWDTSTRKQILTLTGHTNSVNAVAFSPDGKRLATSSFDETVRLWDTSTGEQILTLTGHTKSANAVAFSPDGKRLATGSYDNTARLWAIQIYNILGRPRPEGTISGKR
jgi:sugar lactone lactonase YvrE